MAEFIFALKGNPKNWGSTEAEQKEIMNRFGGWVGSLEGQYKNCRRLRPEMAKISAPSGKLVVDGPFVETKEMFSGIFLIEAFDFEAAVTLAKGCPMLERGEEILVMPVWTG